MNELQPIPAASSPLSHKRVVRIALIVFGAVLLLALGAVAVKWFLFPDISETLDGNFPEFQLSERQSAQIMDETGAIEEIAREQESRVTQDAARAEQTAAENPPPTNLDLFGTGALPLVEEGKEFSPERNIPGLLFELNPR